jgi:NADH:ubiquinone oxidoreductase subunit
MHKIGMALFMLAALLLVGCAGRTKTSTTYDETAESSEVPSEHGDSAEYRMPEPPKTKADDMERTREWCGESLGEDRRGARCARLKIRGSRGIARASRSAARLATKWRQVPGPCPILAVRDDTH